MRINVKEREKKERQVRRTNERKGIDAQRMKHPIPSQTTDALIGDVEQNGKQKREKKNKQGADQKPWSIQSPPTTPRDHMVSLSFLPPLRPTGRSNNNDTINKISIIIFISTINSYIHL